MKVHILEGADCDDCGGGDIVGAYASKDLAFKAASNEAKEKGYDVQQYGMEHYFNFYELEVVEQWVRQENQQH